MFTFLSFHWSQMFLLLLGPMKYLPGYHRTKSLMSHRPHSQVEGRDDFYITLPRVWPGCTLHTAHCTWQRTDDMVHNTVLTFNFWLSSELPVWFLTCWATPLTQLHMSGELHDTATNKPVPHLIICLFTVNGIYNIYLYYIYHYQLQWRTIFLTQSWSLKTVPISSETSIMNHCIQ